MFADIDKPYNTVMTCLKACYVFPSEEQKKNLKKFYVKSFSIRMSAVFIITVGVALHLNMIKREKIEEIDTSEDILTILSGVGTMFILTMVTNCHKSWEKLLTDIVTYKEFKKPENMQKMIQRNNVWSKYFGSYFVAGIFLYASVTVKESTYCHDIRKKLNLNLICDTMLPVWYPFDVPQYVQYLIFGIQFLLVEATLFPTAMIAFLAFEAAELLGVHCESLKNHFRQIIKDKNVRSRPDGIGYWIRYHNHIIRMTEELKVLGKKSVSYMTFITALVLACATNQLIRKIKPIGAVIFLIGWNVGIWMLCLTGETIMQFMASIHDVVYDSDWHLTDKETKKDTIFILLRCQKPLTLDTLPLGTINYSLFILMIKTSYSYFTLLNETA